jgi:hypothetical protein
MKVHGSNRAIEKEIYLMLNSLINSLISFEMFIKVRSRMAVISPGGATTFRVAAISRSKFREVHLGFQHEVEPWKMQDLAQKAGWPNDDVDLIIQFPQKQFLRCSPEERVHYMRGCMQGILVEYMSSLCEVVIPVWEDGKAKWLSAHRQCGSEFEACFGGALIRGQWRIATSLCCYVVCAQPPFAGTSGAVMIRTATILS